MGGGIQISLKRTANLFFPSQKEIRDAQLHMGACASKHDNITYLLSSES
jgi:hypothetical protein